MKNENKKTLDEMIAKMLVNTDELNAEQMQMVDLLCAINESQTIASNVYYETKMEPLSIISRVLLLKMKNKFGASLMLVV